MNKMFSKIAFLGIVFVLFSCDKQQIFDEYREFDGTWKKNDKASFTFEQKDTVSKYNFFINIRNNNDYPYNNLFVIAKLNQPNGKILVDTLEYQMTNPDGSLLGVGFSDIKESKLWYKENFSFSKMGTHTVTLEHALRQTGKVSGLQDLEGVTEVGFRIEKTK